MSESIGQGGAAALRPRGIGDILGTALAARAGAG